MVVHSSDKFGMSLFGVQHCNVILLAKRIKCALGWGELFGCYFAHYSKSGLNLLLKIGKLLTIGKSLLILFHAGHLIVKLPAIRKETAIIFYYLVKIRFRLRYLFLELLLPVKVVRGEELDRKECNLWRRSLYALNFPGSSSLILFWIVW